jgi:hypothetical protein
MDSFPWRKTVAKLFLINFSGVLVDETVEPLRPAPAQPLSLGQVGDAFTGISTLGNFF